MQSRVYIVQDQNGLHMSQKRQKKENSYNQENGTQINKTISQCIKKNKMTHTRSTKGFIRLVMTWVNKRRVTQNQVMVLTLAWGFLPDYHHLDTPYTTHCHTRTPLHCTTEFFLILLRFSHGLFFFAFDANRQLLEHKICPI